VAVTGIGAVCGLGWGVPSLWAGLRAGRTAISSFHRFDHSRHRTHLAAEAGAPPESFVRSCPGWRRLSVADRFALFAAREAVEGAGLAVPFGEEAEAGVYFGSSTGGMYESELFFERFLRDRRGRLSSLIPQQVNAPGDAVARHLGSTGPVVTFSSACASGALALGAALDAVRAGEVEVAVAGGSDSLCQLTYAGFNALRSVDEVPCRPFRAGRAGMSFGEGAAVLVLEPLERARARGARVYAELAGYGLSCDAHHMTAAHPEGEGAARAMGRALADAGAAPEEVSYISAHGTGTPTNDRLEVLAVKRVFGEAARRTPISSIKSMIGHTMGAASAIEAAVCALAVAEDRIPPTMNLEEPEEELDFVPNAARSHPVRLAMNNAYAFGGNNASVLLRKAEA
jgi:3-oxoacyl-[acyl-carrier-protein] synthase II